MEWSKLLCATRVRDFSKEADSSWVPLNTEVRTPFEQDYDRTVFSTPLRRLQDKTQVFPLDPHDFVRTRLTHSIEVSTLARSLARRVGKWMVKEKGVTPEQAANIEWVAATCGLVHDLGNPPFGHAGEKAISAWFQSRFLDDSPYTAPAGSNWKVLRALRDEVARLAPNLRSDFEKFEGNAQTLRLVSRLQVLKDDTGLNLTAGTLSALMKYTASSHEANDKSPRHEFHKPGYFASEKSRVARTRELTGTGDTRNPITFLVEACDDAAYSVLDFEDGIKKGLASWDVAIVNLKKAAEEKKCVPLLNNILENVNAYFLGADLEGRSRDEAFANMFRTQVISRTMADVDMAFRASYADIMAGEFHGELIANSDAGSLIEALKQVDRDLFYRADDVLRLEMMGRRIITDLLDLFMEAVAWEEKEKQPKAKQFAGKLYLMMSSNYRKVFDRSLEEQLLPDAYCRIQLVVDYVCGMTDGFARDLHARLTNG